MRFVGLLVLVVVSACGGKVLYENGPPEATPTPVPTTTPEPVEPPPDPEPTPISKPKQEVSLEVACTRWCENNTQCGKHTINCVQDCMDDAAASCSSKAWVVCAANADEKRCALPSECEQAYCTWAKCAHRWQPDYCN